MPEDNRIREKSFARSEVARTERRVDGRVLSVRGMCGRVEQRRRPRELRAVRVSEDRVAEARLLLVHAF